MPRHRSHSIAFKRQVAQEYIAGETLHGLAKRHDVSRNLIRNWVSKYEAGGFDDDRMAADLVQEQESRRSITPDDCTPHSDTSAQISSRINAPGPWSNCRLILSSHARRMAI